LSAETTETEEIAYESDDRKKETRHNKTGLPVATDRGLNGIEVAYSEIVTRKQIAFAVSSHREGIDHSRGDVDYMGEAFSTTGDRHDRASIGRHEEFAGRRFGIERTDEEARVKDNDVTFRMREGVVRDDAFAGELTTGVERRGEGLRGRHRLIASELCSAIANSIGGADMDDRRYPQAVGDGDNIVAKSLVNRQIVVEMTKRHIGGAGAVDDSVATGGGVFEIGQAENVTTDGCNILVM